MTPEEQDLRYYGIDDSEDTPDPWDRWPLFLVPGTPQADWSLAGTMILLIIALVKLFGG
jgi:hypothetical protein